jgi:ABC-type transport system involved in cytochrome c biogenesis ATPase subunit/GNAT superfamily N-acetyltransferase
MLRLRRPHVLELTSASFIERAGRPPGARVWRVLGFRRSAYSRQSVATYPVLSATLKGNEKRVRLSDGGSSSFTINLHKHALIGPADTLYITPDAPGRISVVAQEDPNDRIVVRPTYSSDHSVRRGDRDFKFRVTELQSPQDVNALNYLEQFHYKTSARDEEIVEAKEAANQGSRRAVLIMYHTDGATHEPAGYIELQMPLLMMKPRHELFDNGFAHDSRQISWTHWDVDAMKNYVNLIVRIARVVTAPDLRGFGLASILVECAVAFAKERWHVRGRRPIFMEISAEMLKNIDFVSRHGFHYVGETEGNLQRVARDMYYMKREYKVSSGIMSLQKKYMETLRDMCVRYNYPYDEILQKIRLVADKPSEMERLSSVEWLLMKSVIREARPYYLRALDDSAQKFLDEYRPRIEGRSQIVAPRANLPPVNIGGLTLASTYRLDTTPNVRLIADAFGLTHETVRTRVVGPLNIQASAGNVIFITGPSGSGKSLLLRALDPSFAERDIETSLTSDGRTPDVAWLRPVEGDLPIIDALAQRWGARAAIDALSRVGLSEALAYVLPFRHLSRGQKYRAMLAQLLLEDRRVWLIDEFCADLDPLTASIVAHNIRKQVVRQGAIGFFAAANSGHYLDVLRPTRIIRLRRGAAPALISYQDYRDELRNRS